MELQGDLASAAGDRLFYHLLALLVLLAAAACFVRVGWAVLRSQFGRKSAPTAELVKVFDDEPDFDPDAALARYQARRPERPEPEMPSSPRPTFGRKRV